MYLKLSVAGHLTIFLTRTRGPFWSIRPARILWMAVLGTQMLATLIAVYGVFMTPLGWGWALFVWGYALAWFLVNDRVKLLAYRIFDPVKAAPSLKPKRPSPKPKPSPSLKPKPSPSLKPRLSLSLKPKPSPSPKPKPSLSLKPRPSRSLKPRAEPAAEAKAEPKPEAKAEASA